MRHPMKTLLSAGAMLLCLAPFAYADGVQPDVQGQTIPTQDTKPAENTKPVVQKTPVLRRSSSASSARKISRRKTKTPAKAPATTVATPQQNNINHDEHGDPSQTQQNADGTLNGSDWH